MSRMHETEYDDAHPSCAETGSTLSVHSDKVSPTEITELLQIQPTSFHQKGDSLAEGKTLATSNAWFYSTHKLSSSKDTRRHIDLVLEVIEKNSEVIAKLQGQGCEFQLASHWVASNPELGGGPRLTPPQMLKLGKLGIPVWFYFISPADAPESLPSRR